MAARFNPLHSQYVRYSLAGASLLILLWLTGLSEQLSLTTTINEHFILVAMLAIILSSSVHIAIRYVTAVQARPPLPVYGIIVPRRSLLREKVLLCFNLGGVVLPVCYCIALMFFFELPWLRLLLATSILTVVSYLLSWPIPRIGIALPIFILPFITAIVCYSLLGDAKVIGAYISGTLAVFLGADLLRFRDLLKLDANFVSIGGSGFLDSIALNAIFAALLLSYW